MSANQPLNKLSITTPFLAAQMQQKALLWDVVDKFRAIFQPVWRFLCKFLTLTYENVATAPFENSLPQLQFFNENTAKRDLAERVGHVRLRRTDARFV